MCRSRPPAGRRRVVLPTQIAIKVRLYQAARKDGISKRELGRRLKWHGAGPQVDRLFNVKHTSRLDQLDAAFRALGLRLGIDADTVPEPRQTAGAKSTQAPSRSRGAKTLSTSPRAVIMERRECAGRQHHQRRVTRISSGCRTP